MKAALLIGVSEYAEGLKPLPAAVNDIEAMRSVLEAPEIGGFDRVVSLPNPDLLTMRRAISTLFSGCGDEDLLLLYFSGHGVTDEVGRFYFTNQDSQKLNGRLDKATVVDASFVHDQMENCESRRMVVILDCCNSGAFGTNISRDEGTIDFSRQLGGEGRIVLTSSSAVEYSFERDGEELAIYTRYLVEGMRTGAADLDEDGLVSANELHEFVKTKLKRAAPSMHPERYVVRDGEKIVLARAAIGDPVQKYRKLVEQYSANGMIRPAGRRMLDRQAQKLGLGAEATQAVEDEVLEPYRQHQANLAEYEEILAEYEFPLDERDQRELKALQQELGLMDENALEIQQRIAPVISKPVVEVVEPVKSSTPAVSVFTFEIITVDSSGQEIDRRPGRAEYFTEEFINLEMVSVPGGSFLMGAAGGELEARDSEQPQHRVTIEPFFMGKFPVTQAQWTAIAKLPKVNCDLNPVPSHFEGKNYPVERVSWDDAIEFCDRLSQKTGKQYRLPSEAEWEYACRAGTTTPFHFGDTITPELVNYDGNDTYANAPQGTYRAQTTDVGSFPPNAFGLFDMHGNVWEWCADHWHDNYTNAPADGDVWKVKSDRENNLRVLRGGSWDGDPRNCRSAFRGWYGRDGSDFWVGFRLALSCPRTP